MSTISREQIRRNQEESIRTLHKEVERLERKDRGKSKVIDLLRDEVSKLSIRRNRLEQDLDEARAREDRAVARNGGLDKENASLRKLVSTLRTMVSTRDQLIDAYRRQNEAFARVVDRTDDKMAALKEQHREGLLYIALALEDDPQNTSPARIVWLINNLKIRLKRYGQAVPHTAGGL